MAKLLLLLSFICLVTLALGTSQLPNDPTFWLAAQSPLFQHVREALAGVLLVQLVTRPPRHLIFRLMTGILSLGVAAWAVNATLAGQMMVLDSLSLLAAALAIGVTSLEVPLYRSSHISFQSSNRASA